MNARRFQNVMQLLADRLTGIVRIDVAFLSLRVVVMLLRLQHFGNGEGRDGKDNGAQLPFTYV